MTGTKKMNRQITNKAILMYIIAVLGSVGVFSCKNPEEQREKDKAELKKQKQEQQRFYNNAYTGAVDSLLNTNGYFDAKFDNTDIPKAKQEKMKAELQLSNFNQFRLEAQVKSATLNVLDYYMTLLSKFLGQYGVNISREQLVKEYTNIASGGNQYLFVGTKFPQGFYATEPYFSLTKNFIGNLFFDKKIRYDDEDTQIKLHKFSTAEQNKIIGTVIKICKAMEADIYNSRKNIEKSFAKYWPVLNLDQIPQRYADSFRQTDIAIEQIDGGLVFGYVNNWRLTNAIYATKYISVYDSKLDMKFFEDKDATYTLKRVAKGKWQVIKKNHNGTIDKTHIFNHNVEYRTCVNVCDKKDLPTPVFTAEPGTNVGVKISVETPVYVKTANAEYHIPEKQEKHIKEKIYAATKNYHQQLKLKNMRDSIQSIAQAEAKIIAINKLKQKYKKNILIDYHVK